MKNCPFCSSFNIKAAGESTIVNGEEFHYIFFECQEEGCKARGPAVGGFGRFATDQEIAEALDKWNKRN